MPRLLAAVSAGLLVACPLMGQAPAARPAPSAEQQIAGAVLPLPDSLRAGARVLGYVEGRLTELRPGTGTMTCKMNAPGERLQAVCYHSSMEAFMARGRELRDQGVTNVDSARNADVMAGRIHLPPAAALYSLNGGSYDPATNTFRGARPLYVVYLPFASEASTGITTTPQPGKPWLMHPGLPGAHVMYAPPAVP